MTATLRDFLGHGMDDLGFCAVDYGQMPALVEAGCFAPGTHRDGVIVGEQETLAGDFGSAGGAAETHKVSGPEPLSTSSRSSATPAHRMAPAMDVESRLVALRVVEAAHQSSRVGRRALLSEMV